jgi:ipoprotein LpqH
MTALQKEILMMPRLMVGLSGAAVVVAALAGCSGNNATTSSSSNASATSAPDVSGAASPQQNKVLVDGQDQGAVEHVHCGTMTDGVRIKIGMGDHGAVVILSDANPPAALGVQLSKTFQNGGVTLEYDSRKNEGDGHVSKQGDFYKITGTAVGKDSSGATQQVSKSFEIDVTCP